MPTLIEKYATLPPVLRPQCRVEYIPPAGAPTGMPVNCAISNTAGWQWQFYEVITSGEGSFTTSTYKSTNPTGNPENSPVIAAISETSSRTMTDPAIRFQVTGTNWGYGRAMFGYIATEPISFDIYMAVSTKWGLRIPTPPDLTGDVLTAYISPAVRLYNQDGTPANLLRNGTVETTYQPTSVYQKSDPEGTTNGGTTESYLWQAQILPATSCPLFLHFGIIGNGQAAGGDIIAAAYTCIVGFKAKPYIPPE